MERVERSEYGFKFVLSLPGIFKVAETICCAVALMCSMIFDSTWSHSLISFFNVIVMAALAYSLIELIIHISHIVRSFSANFLQKYDCIITMFIALFLCCTATSILKYDGGAALTSAVVFGFCGGAVFTINSVYRVQQF